MKKSDQRDNYLKKVCSAFGINVSINFLFETQEMGRTAIFELLEKIKKEYYSTIISKYNGNIKVASQESGISKSLLYQYN